MFCSAYLIVPDSHLLWVKMYCFKAFESEAIFSCIMLAVHHTDKCFLHLNRPTIFRYVQIILL